MISFSRSIRDFFMYILDQNLYFPPLETTHPSGIIALGGDLSTERLLLAYHQGIFPWFEDGEPITWWSPEQRMVCFPEHYQPKKSLRNILNRTIFKVTFNQAFSEVIRHCQQIKREGQSGTWITEDMIVAYEKLHQLGWAKSVEVWQDDVLAGGLYGIDLGKIFCGESMFSKVSNASKVAFHHLIKKAKKEQYLMIDGQVYNEYLHQLGFVEIDRKIFKKILDDALPKK